MEKKNNVPLVIGNSSGLTLLEVVIALTIMILSFASIIAIESNSLEASLRAREMNRVAMLAQSQMADLEARFQGKTFSEFKKEEEGQFPAPHDQYRWKSEIKEIQFPKLNLSRAGSSDSSSPANDSSSSDSSGAQTGPLDTLTQLITQYFSKAIREVRLTISWKKGSGEMSYTVSTYWVDLNHEFKLSL